MEEYKPNSHGYKKMEAEKAAEEREKKGKIVSSGVKTKKKTGLSKFASDFIAEDAKSVKSYIFADVLLPAAKKAVYDIFTEGIDMILYGGKGGGKRKSSGSKVSYRSYYDDRRYDDERRASATTRNRFDFDDIIFDTRGDAEAVLDQMRDVIETYKVVTVADMYDMAGLTEPYTSNKYGWMNLRNAQVRRIMGGGYALDLPKASPLD